MRIIVADMLIRQVRSESMKISPPRLRCRNPGFTRRPWRIQISLVCEIAQSGLSRMKASWRSSLVGAQRSSESRNAISGARAISTPRFRAAAGPRCSICSIRVVSSRLARCSTVPSVEPSSMTINSNSRNDCASTESIASHTIARRLYVGMITETSGVIALLLVSRRRRDRRRGFGGAGRRVPRRKLRRRRSAPSASRRSV